MKPALPPIQVPGETPMEKLDNLFRAVITVPKQEIEKREAEWKKAKTSKRHLKKPIKPKET